jgi:hypothetical protein
MVHSVFHRWCDRSPAAAAVAATLPLSARPAPLLMRTGEEAKRHEHSTPCVPSAHEAAPVAPLPFAPTQHTLLTGGQPTRVLGRLPARLIATCVPWVSSVRAFLNPPCLFAVFSLDYFSSHAAQTMSVGSVTLLTLLPWLLSWSLSWSRAPRRPPAVPPHSAFRPCRTLNCLPWARARPLTGTPPLFPKPSLPRRQQHAHRRAARGMEGQKRRASFARGKEKAPLLRFSATSMHASAPPAASIALPAVGKTFFSERGG